MFMVLFFSGHGVVVVATAAAAVAIVTAAGGVSLVHVAD